MPPPKVEEKGGADRGHGDVEVPSLRTCSGDLSWFGPGRLQDSQGPEVLLAPGPSGLNVSKPGWTGQRTPAPPCQASLALLYNQGAFQLQHFPLSRKPQRKSLLISSRSRGGGSIRRLSGPLGRRQHVLCCRGGLGTAPGKEPGYGREDWTKAPQLCSLCPISIQTTQG